MLWQTRTVRSTRAFWHCSTDMRVEQLDPFGAVVRGFSGSAKDFAQLPGMIARNRVVVLRGSAIDDNALVTMLDGLGEPMFTPGETAVRAAPQLNIVSNVGRKVPPRSVFHTDTSYVAQPPAFTALRAVDLPAMGGATLFCDQVAAAKSVPRRAREWLGGRSVLHSVTGIANEVASHRHPLFRHHPLTEDVALYLSTPERCTLLSGVDAVVSARVIAALYRHSIRPSRLYRHQWHPNDVVIWDNRVTMHRADHDGVIGDRVLHRGMTLGEQPIAA